MYFFQERRISFINAPLLRIDLKEIFQLTQAKEIDPIEDNMTKSLAPFDVSGAVDLITVFMLDDILSCIKGMYVLLYVIVSMNENECLCHGICRSSMHIPSMRQPELNDCKCVESPVHFFFFMKITACLSSNFVS